MNNKAAIYLAGHGSQVSPRLIELQYRRIRRYRELLRSQLAEMTLSDKDVFIDLTLPRFGGHQVHLPDVPAFARLLESVRANSFGIVLVDLDENSRNTHEVAFVREALEAAGATVLNAFHDDMGVFDTTLKDRFGNLAREEDVIDGSDFVCYFPTLAHEIITAALRNEILDAALVDPEIEERLRLLKTLRPYNGGATPFLEDRLSQIWQRR